MSLPLAPGRMIELIAAVLLFGAGVVLYRRRGAAEHRGSQSAVILFVIAVIMAIHALGGLDYHPTQAEADAFHARPR
jgi:hypothetical protein